MENFFKDKRVLFITTKNIDYIRNTQEINLIKQSAAALRLVYSDGKNYGLRLLSIYARLMFMRRLDYDVVFVGFAPQLILPLFGWKFSKAFIMEDFFISMYDTLCCDRKKFKPNGVIGKLLHRIDSRTLKRADAIICDTNAHRDYFCSEFHADSSKMHTLYLEADKSIYHPLDIKRPDKYKNKFIVLYFGSVLPLQGVDIVLDAAKRLKSVSDLHFIFVGPIKNGGVPENVEHIEWLPQNELAKYISYADLCLAGHFSGSIKKARRTIPGKAYIYQAMEKPMILGDNPANHELFKDDDLVSFVKMGDGEALAHAILSRFGRRGEATDQSRS